jgi:hypothetical protein
MHHATEELSTAARHRVLAWSACKGLLIDWDLSNPFGPGILKTPRCKTRTVHAKAVVTHH